MKKKLWVAFSFAIAITLLCAWHFRFFSFKNPYATIPVQFTSSQIPYTQVEIEGQKYFLEIDLGNDSGLSLKKEVLDKLDKKSTGKTFWYDIQGYEYESLKYLIPKVKIANVEINNAVAHDGYKDEVGRLRGNASNGKISGSIGRKLLGVSHHLLLDFHHSVFFLLRTRNALKPLQREGYLTENLIEVPFEGINNRIIFLVDTDVGQKKFLLDTGATYTLIRPSFVTKVERQEMENHFMHMTTSKFVMAGHDFGEMDLHFQEISDKIDDIDGFLGMDFCKKHVIYLDFQAKKALMGSVDKIHSGA